MSCIESKDLVRVIEACGKNGVQFFKSGELEIQFNGFVKYQESDYPVKVEQIQNESVSDPNFILQHNVEAVQDRMESLLIMDPVAYEEALANQDNIEDSDTMTDIEEL